MPEQHEHWSRQHAVKVTLTIPADVAERIIASKRILNMNRIFTDALRKELDTVEGKVQ